MKRSVSRSLLGAFLALSTPSLQPFWNIWKQFHYLVWLDQILEHAAVQSRPSHRHCLVLLLIRNNVKREEDLEEHHGLRRNKYDQVSPAGREKMSKKKREEKQWNGNLWTATTLSPSTLFAVGTKRGMIMQQKEKLDLDLPLYSAHLCSHISCIRCMRIIRMNISRRAMKRISIRRLRRQPFSSSLFSFWNENAWSWNRRRNSTRCLRLNCSPAPSYPLHPLHENNKQGYLASRLKKMTKSLLHHLWEMIIEHAQWEEENQSNREPQQLTPIRHRKGKNERRKEAKRKAIIIIVIIIIILAPTFISHLRIISCSSGTSLGYPDSKQMTITHHQLSLLQGTQGSEIKMKKRLKGKREKDRQVKKEWKVKKMRATGGERGRELKLSSTGCFCCCFPFWCGGWD